MLIGNMMMLAAAHGKRSWSLAGSSRSYEASDPADAAITFALNGVTSAGNGAVKGRVQSDEYNVGDAIVYTTRHSFTQPNDDWGTVYVRLTYNSGSDTVDSSSHAIDGTTWHTFTEDVNNIFWTTTHTSVVGSTVTDVKVEIAEDSGGAVILASGSYISTCSVAV